jgi:N-acetylglutamate synthase
MNLFVRLEWVHSYVNQSEVKILMNNIQIKPMIATDFTEVMALWKNSQGLYMSGEYTETPEGFAKFLERNPGNSYVARDQDKLVGAVFGSHDGRRGFISHMAVAQKYRRSGIGRLLVQHVVESLNSVRITIIVLFVLKSNSSAGLFWSEVGFKKVDGVDAFFH